MDGTHWLRVDATTTFPICSWSVVKARGDARGITVVALGECEAKNVEKWIKLTGSALEQRPSSASACEAEAASPVSVSSGSTNWLSSWGGGGEMGGRG